MDADTTPWWSVVGSWFAEGGRIVRARARSVGLAGGMVLLSATFAFSKLDHGLATWLANGPSPSLIASAHLASRWGELHLAPLMGLGLMGMAGHFYHRPRWVWGACAGLLSGISAGLPAAVLKVVLGRPRPYLHVQDHFTWLSRAANHQSFPSGHSTHWFAIAAAVMVLAPGWGVGFLIGALVVSWARIYSGRHYLSDVVVGAGLGVLVGTILALAILRWHEQRSVNNPAQKHLVPNPVAPSWNGGRFAPWLLLALVLAVYLPGTSQLPLLDRDEPRFATATHEMIERHDWIVPTFNGAYRFDKPALVYWLMRAGYSVVGVNELGARLPAVACMIGLVLLVWATGRRWFGGRAGFAAGLMMATSLQFFIHGRLAVADMPMVLCVAVACVALAELLLAPEAFAGNATALTTESGDGTTPVWGRRLAWWSLWGSIGAGFLAKGPIALAVPALALILWRWVFWRKPLPWKRLQVGRGLVLATGIVAIWGIPALVITHGLFWKVGIGEHVVQRGFEKFNGRPYNPFFYLGTAPLSLFPWIIFAGLAWRAARREWDARRAWLASWLVAPYVIFTAYATQLPHYVLPGFPAFFLLLGAGFTPEAMAAMSRWARVAMAAGLAILGLGLVAGLIWVMRAELPGGLEPLRAGVVGLLTVLAGFLMISIAWWHRHRLLMTVGIVLLGVGAFRSGMGLRAISPAVNMAHGWRDLPADTRHLGWGFSEPSIVFYSGTTWNFVGTPDALTQALDQPGPVLVVVMERECDPLGFFTGHVRWRDRPTPAGLEPTAHRVQSLEAFNLGRSRWQTLTVWFRP